MSTGRFDIGEKIVFCIGLFTLLIPIWSVDFFVTGDGPCHLYNSRILLDWWLQRGWESYAPFYQINEFFDPNWLFNLLTAPLLALFPAALAEKVFLSGYVLLFAFGFRFLIRQINPDALFLSSVALLFCLHRLLWMGFYNNCLSLALWFWMLGWWWRRREQFNWVTLLTSAVGWTLLYAAHPMGLVFTGLSIACCMAGLFWQDWRQQGARPARLLLFKRAGITLLGVLPALWWSVQFALRHSWAAEQTPNSILKTLDNFWRLTPLIALTRSEKGAALLSGILVFALFGYAVQQWRRRQFVAGSQGFWWFVPVAFYCLLFPPSAISGGLEVSARLVILPFFALLFACACLHFPQKIKIAAQTVALALSIAFVVLRWPAQQQASELAAEVFACNWHIKPESTVMALNYDFAGQTPEGEVIANKIWLFGHVDCYIGAGQPAILSDNYEAGYGYFPVCWRWQTGLPGQTDKDGINFYNRPPRADLLSYHRRTGQQLDYVLFVNYREEFASHPYTQEIFSQLDQAYQKVYESPHKRAILYRRK